MISHENSRFSTKWREITESPQETGQREKSFEKAGKIGKYPLQSGF